MRTDLLSDLADTLDSIENPSLFDLRYWGPVGRKQVAGCALWWATRTTSCAAAGLSAKVHDGVPYIDFEGLPPFNPKKDSRYERSLTAARACFDLTEQEALKLFTPGRYEPVRFGNGPKEEAEFIRTFC